MSVSPTSSSASRLYSLGSADNLLTSGLDPSLIVYALQIQQQDKFVLEQLAEIKQIGKLRDAINDELARLRDFKARLLREGKGDGENKHLTSGKLEKDGTISGAWQAPITKVISPDGAGGVSVADGPTLGGWAEMDDGHLHWKITVGDVDKEINRLQGQAQTLDSDRELKMIAMNQFLNKKEQSVSQLTNFLKKKHDTLSAVIANTK